MKKNKGSRYECFTEGETLRKISKESCRRDISLRISCNNFISIVSRKFSFNYKKDKIYIAATFPFILIKSTRSRLCGVFFVIEKKTFELSLFIVQRPVSMARRTGYGDGWRAGRPRRRGLFNFRALRAQAAAWPMLKDSPGRYLPRYYRREEIEEGEAAAPLG